MVILKVATQGRAHPKIAVWSTWGPRAIILEGWESGVVAFLE